MPWNEVSRRYVDEEPEFYIPDGWRKRAEDKKQGSSDETIENIWWIPDDSCYSVSQGVKESMWASIVRYNKMLENGICPEQARMILPQNTMTEWIWSGTLGAFAAMLKLRLDSHTQKETREVAEKIYKELKPRFPVSIEALLNNEQ